MEKELKIKITIDNKTGELKVIANDLSSIANNANNSSKKIDKATTSISSFAQKAVIIAGVTTAFIGVKEAISSLIETAGKFEALNAQLKTATGSAENAKVAFDWIKDFTAKTPYQLEDVTDSFIKLKNYGLEPTKGLLKTLGDTASALGKPLDMAVEAIADAVMGEFERLKEFGIKAKTMGNEVAFNWTTKSGKVKTIVVENNKKVIESTLQAIWNSKYKGGMEEMSQTYLGMVSNMQDNWTLFKDNIAKESGIFDGAKYSLKMFNKEFLTLSKDKEVLSSLGNIGKQVFSGLAFATAGVITSFSGIVMAISSAKAVFQELWNKAKIVFNKIIIGSKKVALAYYENTNFMGYHNNQIKKLKNSISSLNSENLKLKTSITQTSQANSNFVKGLDTLSTKAFKVAFEIKEGFSKTATSIKKDNKSIKEKGEESAKALKNAFSGGFNDINKKSKESAEKRAKELKKIAEREKKAVEEIEKLYLDEFGTKEEKLKEWYNDKVEKINKDIENETTRANTIKTLNEVMAKKLKDIEDDRAKKVKDIIDEIEDKYKDSIQKKEDKLTEWVQKETDAINQNIEDEKERNDALEKLGKAALAEYKEIEKEKFEKAKEIADKIKEENKTIFDKFEDGLKSNVKYMNEDGSTNFKEAAENMGKAASNALQTSLVDVFEGKIETIGGFFSSLWNGIKTSFTTLLAEMATKAIVLNFMNAWSGNGGLGQQGFIEKFLGIDIPFLTFSQGKKPYVWNGYGIVKTPAPTPVSGDSIKNDNVWAKISNEEAVIPKTLVRKYKDIIEAMFNGTLPNYAYGKKPTIIDGVPHFGFGIKSFTKGIKKGLKGIIKGGTKGVLDLATLDLKGVKEDLKEILKGVFEVVKPVLTPIFKNPKLAWLGQIALGATFPALIPAMLNADLLSVGLNLAQGGGLGEALKGAGTAGLIAGAGVSISSLINTGAMPVSNQGALAMLQSYPKNLLTQLSDKWSSIKDNISKLTDVSAVNQEMGSNLTQSSWDRIKNNFLQIGKNAVGIIKEQGSEALEYLSNPSKIFQYILDNLGKILKNITTTITGATANPLIATLIANGISKKKSPLNQENKIVPFANGGIVTKPTIGLVGEAGTEAIIPLNKLDVLFNSKAKKYNNEKTPIVREIEKFEDLYKNKNSNLRENLTSIKNLIDEKFENLINKNSLSNKIANLINENIEKINLSLTNNSNLIIENLKSISPILITNGENNIIALSRLGEAIKGEWESFKATIEKLRNDYKNLSSRVSSLSSSISSLKSSVNSNSSSYHSRSTSYYSSNSSKSVSVNGKTIYSGDPIMASLIAKDQVRQGANIRLFATGGYTGDLPTNAIAGVTHGQEYVIPAKGVPILREKGNSNRELIAEIRALREEVKELRGIREELREIKRNTKETRYINANR